MIGQTIAHYQILEKLGEGGMGVVYKARDTHLDRFVAIKVLPPGRVSDPERKRRFVQEAKAASALNHPNIITIYDISSDKGVDFIAMEYVAGKTLDQLIGRKGLKLSETLKYGIQMADALAAAHGAGIVHRDLKPGNVMVTESGLVKVLDFGLAKLMEPVAGELAPTQTLKPHTEEGKIVGTVAYMSPEQAEGKPVDARSDIFSFGAVLYEMVTGHKAFQRDTQASTLAAILREEPKPASQVGVEVPRDLEKIIARCLRKERERRYQHMADVKLALEELKEESDSGALAGAPAAAVRRRRRGLLWAAGGLAVLLALGAGAWLSQLREAPAPAPVLKPLTSDPGREYHPSFSPEGTQVAYAWNGEKQDNFDIYVKLIDSGARLRLTTDAADEYSPAWSPDGRWIAFLRALPGGRNGVFLISPLGGPERKLAEIRTPGMWWVEVQGPYLAWSPDSKWLALVDQSSPAEPYALFLLSVETLERRRLTSPQAPLFGDLDAAFSPDGHTLAFVRHPGWGSGDLYLLPLTADLRPGGEPKRLTSETRFAANLIWMPGGREIVFISGASYLDLGLWRIGVSGAGKPERLQSFGEGIRFPAISHQGKRLAFARLSTDSNIWRAELAPPGGRASASVRLIASTRVDWTPDYSPDGKKISFISDRSGSFEVWVCDSDGSNPVPLASLGDRFTFFTRWSPDGRRILFCSTAEGQREIYAIDAQGGQPRRLTNHPAHDTFPSWSRDGRWIYFSSSRGGEEQVWKMRAEGGEARQVTRNGGLLAIESPDGRFLYYVKGRGVTTLWKAPVEGGPETQVLAGVHWLDFAVTKDGIYFCRPDPPRYWIEFLSFVTGRTSHIIEAKSGVLGMSVSPDGRWLLYSQIDDYASDLMLVENFR
jgi:Tol biopolymer transport system component/predicted Ser/Thr protein kinase